MRGTIAGKRSGMPLSFGVAYLLLGNLAIEISLTTVIDILLGIGRNATGSTAFPRERRAKLERLPGDWYTGWYSCCPVPTVVVVLSLLLHTGTNMAP
jgi:hypothetical protein